MLNDKVIVITGGAGLLGRNFSQAVAAQGGVAIVADVNLPAAEAVAAKIAAEYPGRAQAALLDITDKASIDGLIETLHAKYGRIDAVVNNAYPHNANRASNAKVEVRHLGGTKVVTVNQKDRPPIDGLWVSLGTFDFTSTEPASVIVSNEGADGFVVIDAVQWLAR